MKKQRMPVIVATQDALRLAMAEDVCVLYVDNSLYLQDKSAIDNATAYMGYSRLKRKGKQGAFFVRAGGTNCFQEELHEIYDPLNIL